MELSFGKDGEETALNQLLVSLRGEVSTLSQNANEMRADIDDIAAQDLDEMKENISTSSTKIYQVQYWSLLN